MSRILIHEPRPCCHECRETLAGLGHDLVECRDRESLVASLAEGRPDVVVYVLGDLYGDLGVLSALRRAAPQMPFILLGGSATLETRRVVQDLKPTYFGVFPLECTELSDAVRGALTPRAGRS